MKNQKTQLKRDTKTGQLLIPIKMIRPDLRKQIGAFAKEYGLGYETAFHYILTAGIIEMKKEGRKPKLTVI